MNINKFVKKKNGMYSIFLEDGDVLVVHEDLILKYDLLLLKDMSLELLDKIIDDTSAVIKESSVDKLQIVKKLSKFWMGVSLFANDFNNSDDINQSSLDIKASFSDLVTAIEKTVLNSDSNILPFIKNLMSVNSFNFPVNGRTVLIALLNCSFLY